MANQESDVVVFIDQSYGNGLSVDEVRAIDSGQALDEAYERNDIDPMRTAKFVRSSWCARQALLAHT